VVAVFGASCGRSSDASSAHNILCWKPRLRSPTPHYHSSPADPTPISGEAAHHSWDPSRRAWNLLLPFSRPPMSQYRLSICKASPVSESQEPHSQEFVS
jgi:hypothetical protein